MNKKGLSGLAVTGIVLGALALLVIIFLSIFIGSYNSLVTLEETVDAKWANVESAYQRRADLVPNLVATVQESADFQQETQTQIAAVRSQAVTAQQAMNDAQSPEEFQAASQQVEAAVGAFRGLNINVERYPNLDISTFNTLQDQLEGTENRVKTERDIYNEAVRQYNIKTRRFPSNIIAGMFGFEQKDLFEAQEGADEVPDVNFN